MTFTEGSVASDYVPLPLVDDLAQCQRYAQWVYQRVSTNGRLGMGMNTATNVGLLPVSLQTLMGGAPSITVANATGFNNYSGAGTNVGCSSVGNDTAATDPRIVSLSYAMVGGVVGTALTFDGGSGVIPSVFAEWNP